MANRGSVFRKWDLHIHTPESFQHNFAFSGDSEKYKGDIWEKYIQELEYISDISVLGITDYFSIDGYKKVLGYKHAGRLNNFNLILPNIEFRLDLYIGKKSRRLNYHVIFSEEVDINQIEKEFLEKLTVKTSDGEDRTLSRKNIEDIGESLKKHQASLQTKSSYVVGCENVTCSFDKILDVLNKRKSIFEGKYLLVLPEEGWCLLDWDSQDHLIRKQLYKQSDAIFSSNSKTRDWALGLKDATQKDFIDEFGALKPCIHGSDAHSFDKLCKPDLDRFCWIKADPSFQGLKQIKYEPEERVRISNINPESNKSIFTLYSVEIRDSKIGPDLEIEEIEIPLNSNLIAVIGGKGSGKTALLDLIANCFEDRCARAFRDKNSFVQRVEEQKPDLKTDITFVGDDVESFTKKLTDETFFESSKLTYLPQGRIEEYSGNRTELHKKIKEIVFNSKEAIESENIEEFDKAQIQIEELKNEIATINSEIVSLENETKPEVIDSLVKERALYEGEHKNKTEKLQVMTDNIGDAKEKVEHLHEEETKLKFINSNSETLRHDLEEFKTNLETLAKINHDAEKLNDRLTESNISICIPFISIDGQLTAVNLAISSIESKIDEMAYKVKQTSDKIKEFSGINEEYLSCMNDIENNERQIKAVKEKLDLLESKKLKIKDLNAKRTSKYIELLKKYLLLKKVYEGIIKAFSEGKDKILQDIDFKSELDIGTNRFIEVGDEITDRRKLPYDKIVQKADQLLKIIVQNSEIDAESEMVKYLSDLLEYRQYIKGRISNLDFYNWVFGNYFQLITETYFNATPMDKLSIGQKGTVLLKIFLAEGDYPLVIDQPEENLDNKFIYEALVGSFRDAKKKRQIIIATHNANLVVNSDAEQIIVAEYKNNKITYKIGSLENQDKRKNIAMLLEGGEEAFKKREEKYSF